MIQFCFLMALYLAGILFAMPFRKGLPFAFLCITGFLWGSLFWVFANVVVQLSRIPNSPLLIAGVAACGIALLLILSIRRGTWRLTKSEARGLLGGALAFAGVSATALNFNLTVISYDSFVQMLFGTYLGEGMNQYLRESAIWAGWGIFLPAIHAAPVLFGMEYLSAFQPVFWLSFIAAFYYLSVRAIPICCVHARFAPHLSVLTVLALGSSYFVLFQAFYIHNSLPTAAYFLLFTVTAWLAIEENRPAWLVFSILSLTAFSLCRLENPMYVPVFLSILFGVGRFSWRRQVACALPLLVFLMVWYGFLAYMMGQESNIISGRIALYFVAGLGAYAVWVLLSWFSWAHRITLISRWLMLVGAALALIAVFAWQPQHMDESLRAIAKNMIRFGLWSSLWVLLLVLCVFAPALPSVRSGSLFTHSLAIYLVAILALAAGRTPYREGCGDSGNRMLTHLAPVLLFYLQMRYAKGLLDGVSLRPAVLKSRGLLVAGEVAILLAGAVFFYATRQVDYAVGARVVQAPAFTSQKYTFSVALRGIVDDRYVAAARPGPATVVLDLGRKVKASVLEMVEYHGTERFTDFAWHVSLDGKEWKEVYDTRTKPEPPVKQIGPWAYRYPLHDKGEFRFVRLTFRAAIDQNRLAMRKVSIYKDPPL
jgi:hypothetical protein